MDTKEYNRKYRAKYKKRLSEQHKIWYQSNKERLLKKAKKYYIENGEKIRADVCQYKSTHKKKVKEWNKAYIILYADKLREYWKIYARKWRVKNPERVKEIKKRYVKNNYDQVLTWNGNRRARLRGAKGSFNLKEWLKLKMQFNYTCPKCNKKEPEILLTQDHIIPLSLGGNNYISNIQPLCRSCNPSKGIRIERYSYVN